MEFLSLLLLIGYLVFLIWIVVWIYGDAESRGFSGCLVVLLVLFLTWPVALVLWFLFRPASPQEDQQKG